MVEDWKVYLEGDTSLSAQNRAIHYLLKSIDSHSFHVNKETVKAWENTSSSEDDIELCKGELLDSDYGYIWMPGVNTGDSITQKYFAEHLQHLIDSLDHDELKGWVVDLRNNTGGNCWPMLTGIGPILGEGESGYFKTEEEFDPWIYKDGKSYQGDFVHCQIDKSAYQLINPENPIAVLTSDQTGSSGEIIAASFKNRAKTILIGTKTAGYSTGNANYPLLDGSMMFLTTSIYCDRNKNEYPDGLEPDILVEQNAIEDIQLEKALNWLRKK